MKKESHFKKLNEMNLEELSRFEEYTVKNYIDLYNSKEIKKTLKRIKP